MATDLEGSGEAKWEAQDWPESSENSGLQGPRAGKWSISGTQMARSTQPGRTVEEREAVEKVTWLNHPTYMY